MLADLPAFPRLHEYFGLWAYEPEAFFAQWSLFRATDLTRHAAAPAPGRSSTMTMEPGKNGQSVAVIGVGGTLMKQQSSMGGTSTIQLRRDIRTAANDPTVSGILLAIDSPGGAVAGMMSLAADVNAARRKKPLWAGIDDLGASAAYWLASQADAVYASSPTALVGSIGTIMTVYDVSKAAEAEGVKPLVFATGPLKGAGTPGTEITQEQRDYFQGLIDDTQQHFDAAVRKGRNLSAADLAKVRSGGVFPAAVAKDLKLIDGIQPLEKTLADLASAK